MKICFLMVSHWSAVLGGAEIQVRYIMEHLRASRKHEVFMICRHTRMRFEGDSPIFVTSSLWPFGRYLKSADYPSIRGLLEHTQPDVVYTRVMSPFVAFGADYCRRHDRRLVYHIAHIEDVSPSANTGMRRLPRQLERPLFEWGLRQADVIIAQAQYQAELLRRNFGLSCAAVIPNVHPVPEVRPRQARPVRVVWIATVKKVKQPELFLELAKACRDIEGVEFLMIGGVRDKAYGSFERRTRGIVNLQWLGELPIEAANDVLGSCHVFVNTSERFGEGFPNSFIQAWLRGVPVVSLEVDPDDILAIRGLGFCAKGDYGALVAMIRELVLCPSRLEELGQEVRRYSMEKFGASNLDRLTEVIVGT